jgi:hypothetical protein
MKKAKSVAQLKKEADKYWSRYIRYRDGKFDHGAWYSQCITCQRWIPLAQCQAGHFVSRRVNSLRFDEENVNAQCISENMFKQGDQYNYAIQLDLKYGDGTAKKLHDRRFETHKFTAQELLDIIAEAKENILSMETK